MAVFDEELYAVSCALQYDASLSPPPKVVGLSIDSLGVKSAISRPGYPYQAPLLHDIHHDTSSLHLSCSAVLASWTPNDTGIIGNALAGAAAELAVDEPPQISTRGRTPTCACTYAADLPGAADPTQTKRRL